MERSYIEEVLKGKKENVLVKGWVHESRDLGKIRFLLLRDMSGIIQITSHKDKANEKIFELMKKVNRESVLGIEGKAVKSKQAPGGIQIVP